VLVGTGGRTENVCALRDAGPPRLRNTFGDLAYHGDGRCDRRQNDQMRIHETGSNLAQRFRVATVHTPTGDVAVSP